MRVKQLLAIKTITLLYLTGQETLQPTTMIWQMGLRFWYLVLILPSDREQKLNFSNRAFIWIEEKKERMVLINNLKSMH